MNKNNQAVPSPWIITHANLVAGGARVLDLAAGKGRHSRLFLDQGTRVTAVDLDCSALKENIQSSDLTVIETDLEKDPWPFEEKSFDTVVVTNYLWRPLFGSIGDVLVPGGILLYETFALGNEAYGKPSNPEFLLRPGELKDAFERTFEILAFEEALDEKPHPSVRQRLAARKL